MTSNVCCGKGKLQYVLCTNVNSHIFSLTAWNYANCDFRELKQLNGIHKFTPVLSLLWHVRCLYEKGPLLYGTRAHIFSTLKTQGDFRMHFDFSFSLLNFITFLVWHNPNMQTYNKSPVSQCVSRENLIKGNRICIEDVIKSMVGIETGLCKCGNHDAPPRSPRHYVSTLTGHETNAQTQTLSVSPTHDWPVWM